ncbi:MAG: hypothetical protein ACRDYV_06960 [Acidimicrobiia bacterium]
MAPAAPRRKSPGVPAPEPGEVDVRHVQPYEALKTYRCPGCDHEIPPGTGHKVVVPRADPDLRRHWHNGCWGRASRPPDH